MIRILLLASMLLLIGCGNRDDNAVTNEAEKTTVSSKPVAAFANESTDAAVIDDVLEETTTVESAANTSIVDESADADSADESNDPAVLFEADENGCYPGEYYDTLDGLCYLDCETDAECDLLEAEINARLAETTDDPETEAEPEPTVELEPEPAGEPLPEPNSDPLPTPVSSIDGELPPFAVYAVDENLELELLQVVDDTAVDTEQYEAIWAVIRELLPPDILIEEVYEYHIFTDGPDETLAYVESLPDNPDQWLMAIDMADVQVSNNEISDDVLETIVHEFAHILTLEDSQVPPDPNAMSEEGSPIADACQTFYSGEGCSLPDAYINQFYLTFWDDIFDELLEIEQLEDQTEFDDALYEFYEKYEERFVSDYAATNPAEDIAESFTYFVLYEEPTGSTVADEKIRFFYDYPELVAMSDHINGYFNR